MYKVIRWIGLNPEQERRVFAETLLKQFQRFLLIAELGVQQRQVNRGDVAGFRLALQLIQLEMNYCLLPPVLEGTLNSRGRSWVTFRL